MKLESMSIAEQIETLARMTGASESFVVQVRALFSSKGIPLDSDAAPYVEALEAAFLREEQIRENARRVRRRLARLGGSREEVERPFSRQPDRMERIRQRLREIGLSTTVGSDLDRAGARSVVLQQQSDEMPLVPGPTEPQ